MKTKPTYPDFIQQIDSYIDYEIRHELPPFDGNEHSVKIVFTYDIKLNVAEGLVVYEQNGNQDDLGAIELTNEQFYRITNHPIRPDDKLAALRNVEGSITIKDGVATLPDRTTINL